jgi:hypothetical protein
VIAVLEVVFGIDERNSRVKRRPRQTTDEWQMRVNEIDAPVLGGASECGKVPRMKSAGRRQWREAEAGLAHCLR